MVNEATQHNATDIRRELNWLKQILSTRSALNAHKQADYSDVVDIPLPDLSQSKSAYAALVHQYQLGFIERFLIILAAVPELQPELLDVFIQKNPATQQLYTEFGGRLGEEHSGFLPTGETVMFILAANDLARRFQLQQVFEVDHLLYRQQIVWLEEPAKGDPLLSARLTLSPEILDLITTGKVRAPKFSAQFPAQRLDTQMGWEDLVLHPFTRRQIREIDHWLNHHHTLMQEWQMRRTLKPGFKALFYGPPGTGKTLTAALLGKQTGMEVYRIDLSQMVSKYIGETEKNLARVFDKAENKHWILFFDEGDALFGKRTETRDAHDRFANQQVSYLLQRIEAYAGLVVLSTNRKNDIDEAFLRRFQTIIHFPMPQEAERLQLWRQGFSPVCTFETNVDLEQIARRYEMAGGSIINVIQYCSLQALAAERTVIHRKDLIEGVKREFLKAGRTV